MKNDEMKEMQFSNLLSFVHAKNKIKWRGGEMKLGEGQNWDWKGRWNDVI